MKLRTSPASPYGRKVKMSALVLGLADGIESIPSNTRDPNDPLIDDNPLGKIPILLEAGRPPLFDSVAICEYLAACAGDDVLFPKEGNARWDALRLHALANGVIEAALLLVYEKRFRPEEKWHQPWIERQQAKIDRALALLESDPPQLSGSPNIGQVTLACALGYLDFRHGGTWRAGHPKLVKWLETFEAEVPAFAATTPHD